MLNCGQLGKWVQSYSAYRLLQKAPANRIVSNLYMGTDCNRLHVTGKAPATAMICLMTITSQNCLSHPVCPSCSSTTCFFNKSLKSRTTAGTRVNLIMCSLLHHYMVISILNDKDPTRPRLATAKTTYANIQWVKTMTTIWNFRIKCEFQSGHDILLVAHSLKMSLHRGYLAMASVYLPIIWSNLTPTQEHVTPPILHTSPRMIVA